MFMLIVTCGEFRLLPAQPSTYLLELKHFPWGSTSVHSASVEGADSACPGELALSSSLAYNYMAPKMSLLGLSSTLNRSKGRKHRRKYSKEMASGWNERSGPGAVCQ